jgi:ribosome-associated translation inhibitor RaiA
MTGKVPLYVIGLAKDEPANEILASKFGGALEKVQHVLPDIIEAKISVETQNTEGSRTHYDAKAIVTTPKHQLVYTDSGWDILKIADELCRKLEGEMPKHDDKRQRDSIRKREY